MSIHPSDANQSIRRAPRGSGESRNGKTGQDSEFEACVSTVLDTIEEKTGTRYLRRDVASAVHDFLRGRSINDPLAYVRKTLKTNYRRFLPTPSPPPLEPP